MDSGVEEKRKKKKEDIRKKKKKGEGVEQDLRGRKNKNERWSIWTNGVKKKMQKRSDLSLSTWLTSLSFSLFLILFKPSSLRSGYDRPTSSAVVSLMALIIPSEEGALST